MSTGDSGAVRPSGIALMNEVDRAIRLAADSRVVAVVGPGGSREALETAPIYRAAEIPQVVPTATTRQLTGVGAWTFVLAPNDSMQAEFIAVFATERLAARRALVFYLPDEYGLGLATASAAALLRRGVTVIDRIPVRPFGTCAPLTERNAYEGAVDAAVGHDAPDVAVLATRTTETACLARALQRRVPGIRMLAGDGALVDERFVSLAGTAADSVYLVAFWHPGAVDSVGAAFVARFERIVRRRPRHDDAMFYDAVMLVMKAISVVGPHRDAIRGYLADLGVRRPAYVGVTGPIAFGPGARRPLVMTRIRRGVTEIVPPP
jgi:branched-chain amino acid transport system substrate-binding protein